MIPRLICRTRKYSSGLGAVSAAACFSSPSSSANASAKRTAPRALASMRAASWRVQAISWPMRSAGRLAVGLEQPVPLEPSRGPRRPTGPCVTGVAGVTYGATARIAPAGPGSAGDLHQERDPVGREPRGLGLELVQLDADLLGRLPATAVLRRLPLPLLFGERLVLQQQIDQPPGLLDMPVRLARGQELVEVHARGFDKPPVVGGEVGLQADGHGRGQFQVQGQPLLDDPLAALHQRPGERIARWYTARMCRTSSSEDCSISSRPWR